MKILFFFKYPSDYAFTWETEDQAAFSPQSEVHPLLPSLPAINLVSKSYSPPLAYTQQK